MLRSVVICWKLRGVDYWFYFLPELGQLPRTEGKGYHRRLKGMEGFKIAGVGKGGQT